MYRNEYFQQFRCKFNMNCLQYFTKMKYTIYLNLREIESPAFLFTYGFPFGGFTRFEHTTPFWGCHPTWAFHPFVGVTLVVGGISFGVGFHMRVGPHLGGATAFGACNLLWSGKPVRVGPHLGVGPHSSAKHSQYKHQYEKK